MVIICDSSVLVFSTRSWLRLTSKEQVIEMLFKDWTEEQAEQYQRCVQFAEEELNRNIVSRDRDCEFDASLWEKCAQFGVLGWCMPVEYGGSGFDIESTIIMLEGIGYGCRDNSLTLGLNGQIWSVQEPLCAFGNEDQKEKYLRPLCEGHMKAAHGMTEVESGSDAFNLKTSAVKTSGGYVLNGEKAYVGLAPVAEIALVFANTNPEAGSWGISAFIVERDFEGYAASEPVEKMGLRSNPAGTITLTDCFVPEENRLGPEGIGVSMFNHSMDWERGFIFASHVGSMGRQLDRCIQYARQRHVFGQPISEFQAISHRIVKMRERLDSSKMMLYRVAGLKGQGRTAVLEAAMAKQHISDAFVQNSIDAILVHGALGYMTDSEVERDLRDAAGGMIYSGTNDIQKNIIASILGL